MKFAQITREADVKKFTGVADVSMLKFLYEELSKDARSMRHWRGGKHTDLSENSISNRKGPAKKLRIEHEFLLTLMKLHLGLLNDDVAWRFDVSSSLISEVFFTWMRLIALDLRFMIIWPSRGEIKRNLPEVFRRHFCHCVAIIDCTESLVETPSNLENQAMLWSTYQWRRGRGGQGGHGPPSMGAPVKKRGRQNCLFILFS